MDSMSCLLSVSLVFAAIGTTVVMLNCLTFVPSATQMFFSDVFVALNDPSHCFGFFTVDTNFVSRLDEEHCSGW